MASSPSAQDPKKNEKPRFGGKVEDFCDYAKQNKWDSAALIVLLIGLIAMLFVPLSGGIIVGLVVGLYFSNEIVTLIKNRKQIVYETGTSRSLVFLGTCLAFLIAAPGVFIGAAIVTAVKGFAGSR